MKALKPFLVLLAVLLVGILAGCKKTAKSADVSGSIRQSLDQAGLKKVSAGQDRDHHVITLSGIVGSQAAKLQAESIVKSIAGGESVSDQIVVLSGDIDTLKDNNLTVVNSNLDKGGVNVDGALAITSQSDPRSNCQQYTDVYLLNSSLRTISVDIKRSNNVDNQTSVLTYTTNPSTTPPDAPGSSAPSMQKIGCLFDGAKIYTYTIARAEYR